MSIRSIRGMGNRDMMSRDRNLASSRNANAAFSSSIFDRYLVEEVIVDPMTFSMDSFIKEKRVDANISILDFPKNTLIVRQPPIKSGKITFCFPFFPSHIQIPVKPGEYVWAVNGLDDFPMYLV